MNDCGALCAPFVCQGGTWEKSRKCRCFPGMRQERRKLWLEASQGAILVAALLGAVLSSRASDWHPASLVLLLLALVVATDQFAIATKRMRISGGHVSFVLAMAL